MQNQSRIQPQQLIDQHKNFNISAVQNIVTNLPNVEKQYFNIAIVGVQNSGKSTLLNKIFGTNFQVLQKVAGSRTTRGILLSLDKQQNYIIMDVEGNDSMDRVQEQDYEKMVATFALVSADVLIINIWAKSLGQYSGSQYETLTTILQICIDQFKQQSPKTILFCVRDFNDQIDDQGQIRRKIVKDVNNIWLKIEKPKEYQKYQNTPQKFFNVQVSVLHKYKPDNPTIFLADIQKLRKRFTDPKDDNYLFSKKKTTFNLPLKDLPKLQQNSWKSIITNKKLNLPNQKQQLSNFRCSQILKDLSTQFQQEIKKIQQENRTADFGKLQESYLKEYQKLTYLYGKHVVEQKQAILKQQIIDIIQKVIGQIIERQQNKLKQQFKTRISSVDSTNSISADSKLNQIKLQIVEKLSETMKSLNYEIQGRKQKIQQIIQYFNKQITFVKNKFIQTIKTEFQKQYCRSMRLLSSQVLNKYFGCEFWTHVNKQYSQKKNCLISDLEQKNKWVKNRLMQPLQIDQIDQQMLEQLKKCIRQQLQKSLINRVFQVFIAKFTKNNEGVSYNFNIIDDQKIGQIYDDARQQCQTLVNNINNYNVERSKKSSILIFDNQTKDQFFESTWLSNVLNQLDKKMINEHQTTIRRKKQSQMKKVPWWLLAIILYFVYDDLWFPSDEYPIINNLLTVIMIFITFFFSIGQQKAFFQLWDLMLDGMKHLSAQVSKKLKK